MNFDSFSLKAAISELQPLIEGAFLQKISQIAPFDLVFQTYSPGNALKLLVSLKPNDVKFALLDDNMPPAQIPTSFVMLMRKHMQGKKIESIYQPGLERTICIKFENWTIAIEIPGRRNNIFLVNKDNKITNRMLGYAGDIRTHKPGLIYPGTENELPDASLLSEEAINGRMASFSGKTAKEALRDGFFGIPPRQAKYICQKIDIDLNAILTDAAAEKLGTALAETIKKLTVPPFTPAATPDGRMSPWPLGLEGEKTFRSFSEMQEVSVEPPGLEESKAAFIKSVQKIKAKKSTALERRLKDLENAQKCEHKKTLGNLLLANLQSIPPKASSAELYDIATGETITVPLDPRLTASANAQKYFKDYKRLRRACQALEEPIAKAREELNFIEEILLFAESADTIQDLEEIHRLWSEETGTGFKTRILVKAQGPRVYKHKGFKILVGRNPLQNDKITSKIAVPGDIWLHARGVPGAHVVIKSAGRIPEQETILAAAVLAARHSKAKEDTKADIIFTDAKYVHKPPQSPPGRVVVKSECTITVSPQTIIEGLSQEE